MLANFQLKVPGARSKQGEGIIYITMRNLVPASHPPFMEHARRWVVWHGMKASLWDGVDYFRNGVIVIADLKDMGWENMDMEMQTKMGSSFIDNFPMRVSKIFLLNAPWIITAVLDGFRLFMKKKIMDRISVLEDTATLREFIEPNNLHVNYGGELKYTIPEWFSYIESEYEKDVMEDVITI